MGTSKALRKAFKKYKLNHAVSFHSRNHQAMEFVEVQQALNGAGLFAKLKTFRVSSDITASKRQEQLRSFVEAKKALISNSHCLTEGVDVPGIDLVLFAQPRKSKVDIVQAVGRALRVPSDQPDKHGYVLVPVLIDDDEEDLENIVHGTGFENLITVLKAMATVDEDIIYRADFRDNRATGEASTIRWRLLDLQAHRQLPEALTRIGMPMRGEEGILFTTAQKTQCNMQCNRCCKNVHFSALWAH